MAINLLPWRERQAIRRARQYCLYLLISLSLTLIAVLATREYLNYSTQSYTLKNLHLTQEIGNMSIVTDEKKLAMTYEIAAQQVKLIQAIHINQVNFWQELDLLEQKLPETMQITHLNWNIQTVRLQGLANNSEQVGLLVNDLEKSQLFSQIFLEKINKDDAEKNIHFTIIAEQKQESTL